MAFGGMVASPALADRVYFGAGLGNAFFSSEFADAEDQIHEIDENSTAWKVFAGVNAPSIIGLEGVHLGPFGVRLEWESAEVDKPDNLSMVSRSGTLGS